MGNVRGSRIAFAAAYVALVVGLFVALGGVAYAQSLPSAATDQYGDEGKVTEVNVDETRPAVAGVTVSETASEPQVVESQALPVTGLSLLGTAVIGGALVALGIALRRRERTDDR
jgi:hypothetical protein